jgi:DNA polymerase I-like protein with 3'-5' exonuclease and polymerase domains
MASAGYPLRTPVFGHTLGYDDGPTATFNGRTARNFGVQAVAADIIHTVSVFAFLERRPRWHVLGTAHDSVVIEAPTSEIDAAVVWMQGIMDRAVKTVLGPGAFIRVKTKITHGPDACNWEDSGLFDLLVRTIEELEREEAA